ncbi:MAG: hypothetical protein NXI24_19215 [bacterium]|nr:hypothetical protein [bacterium]
MKIDLVKSSPVELRSLIALALRALVIATIAAGVVACSSSETKEEGAGAEENGTTEEAMERGEAAIDGKGCVIGDCENGSGTFVYENGDRYVGDFKNGERDGKGTFEYANGDRFIGGYANGERNGEGTYVFANGDRYVGQFQNGLRAGKGVYTFGGGGVFRGQFEQDGDKGNGTLVQGETPFDCDLRNKGLYCEASKEGKVIKEAVDDSGLSGENQ